MEKFPLVISTLTSSQRAQQQEAVGRYLSQYWVEPEVEWPTVVAECWIEIALDALSATGPPGGRTSLQEMQALWQEHFAEADLQGRLLILLCPYEDAVASYAAFATFLQRHLTQQVIMIMSASYDGHATWDVGEANPAPSEIFWKDYDWRWLDPQDERNSDDPTF